MNNVKFYQGTKEKYDPSSMEDGIFFSTDTQEILLNDKTYGGSITSIKFQDNKIIINTSTGDTQEVELNTASTLLDGLMSSEDKSKLDGLPEGQTINEILDILYNQYTSVTLNVSPTIIEKGISTNITLNWNCTFNGQTTTPDSMQLKSGSAILVSDKAIKTYSEQISDTKSYIVEAVNHGITKTISRTVNAYYPMYFGSSAKTDLVSANILSFNKQAIKANPTGSYSFTVNEGEYAWLCIPSTMNINKVTSGGFDVPFESPVTIAVDGKGNYKCYRSSSTFVAGTFNCVIS